MNKELFFESPLGNYKSYILKSDEICLGIDIHFMDNDDSVYNDLVSRVSDIIPARFESHLGYLRPDKAQFEEGNDSVLVEKLENIVILGLSYNSDTSTVQSRDFESSFMDVYRLYKKLGPAFANMQMHHLDSVMEDCAKFYLTSEDRVENRKRKDEQKTSPHLLRAIKYIVQKPLNFYREQIPCLIYFMRNSEWKNPEKEFESLERQMSRMYHLKNIGPAGNESDNLSTIDKNISDIRARMKKYARYLKKDKWQDF